MTIYTQSECAEAKPFKPKFILLAKNGRASRALIKNSESGNVKNIKAMIKRGTLTKVAL